MSSDEYLTVKEFSNMSGIPLSSAYRLLEENKLPYYRYSDRRIRVHIDDIRKFMEESRRGKKPTLVKRKKKEI